MHALLQNFALRRLRVAKVHHLVHELVDDDKVVADRLLLELLEVLDEHLHEPVQEDDHLRRVRVPPREREHCPGGASRQLAARLRVRTPKAPHGVIGEGKDAR
jgi:hypothetical protein